MIAAADAVSVAVPTVDHHGVVRLLLEAGRDVLVEKPMTRRRSRRRRPRRVARERGRILQVGHIERFNPAADAPEAARPASRASSRSTVSAPFSPRSLDIDVVLDLMIHDLDIC